MARLTKVSHLAPLLAICAFVGLVVIVGVSQLPRIPFISANIRWHEDIANQMNIARAAVAYNEKHGRLPSSIKVLVEENYLPEAAAFYASPYLDLKGKLIDFRESSYEIEPDANSITNGYYILRKDGRDSSGTEPGSFIVSKFIEENLRENSREVK